MANGLDKKVNYEKFDSHFRINLSTPRKVEFVNIFGVQTMTKDGKYLEVHLLLDQAKSTYNFMVDKFKYGLKFGRKIFSHSLVVFFLLKYLYHQSQFI